MTFVLVETLAGRGHMLWFKQMTAMGPMSTPRREEAAVFATEYAARHCPALWHPLSFYEIRAVEPVAPVTRGGHDEH